ncbi:hypothetical protein [Enterovibrio norvegicus]|uniref:hypothetical protein n=1 Tax=Enterovibrio norvegicus TaxID=188144 RepID=UPI00352EA063
MNPTCSITLPEKCHSSDIYKNTCDLPPTLVTQDYALKTGFKAFSCYSNKPYKLTLEKDFDHRLVNGRTKTGFGDFVQGLMIDKSDLGKVGNIIKIIRFTPNIGDHAFAFSGIDTPLLLETYVKDEQCIKLKFVFIEDNEYTLITPELHPEIFSQMYKIYTNLLNSKRVGMSLDKEMTIKITA